MCLPGCWKTKTPSNEVHGSKNCFDSSYTLRFSRGFGRQLCTGFIENPTLSNGPFWLAQFRLFRSFIFLLRGTLVKHHTVRDYNSQLSCLY